MVKLKIEAANCQVTVADKAFAETVEPVNVTDHHRPNARKEVSKRKWEEKEDEDEAKNEQEQQVDSGKFTQEQTLAVHYDNTLCW